MPPTDTAEKKEKLDPAKYANVAIDQVEVPAELPTQGSFVPLLPFAKYWLKLPADLAKCVEVYEQDIEGSDKPVPRVRYRFDRDHPLLVQLPGTEWHEHPIMDSVTNQPRKKRDDSLIPGNLLYLIREALGDQTPIAKLADWWMIMNKHAGKLIYAEIGGRASCRDDLVRYITVDLPGGAGTETKEDPSGTFGCGERYYSRDIPKGPDGKAVERFACGNCGASLRVFNQIERFLKPPAK